MANAFTLDTKLNLVWTVDEPVSRSELTGKSLRAKHLQFVEGRCEEGCGPKNRRDCAGGCEGRNDRSHGADELVPANRSARTIRRRLDATPRSRETARCPAYERFRTRAETTSLRSTLRGPARRPRRHLRRGDRLTCTHEDVTGARATDTHWTYYSVLIAPGALSSLARVRVVNVMNIPFGSIRPWTSRPE